jgi:hypothetical protein
MKGSYKADIRKDTSLVKLMRRGTSSTKSEKYKPGVKTGYSTLFFERTVKELVRNCCGITPCTLFCYCWLLKFSVTTFFTCSELVLTSRETVSESSEWFRRLTVIRRPHGTACRHGLLSCLILSISHQLAPCVTLPASFTAIVCLKC